MCRHPSPHGVADTPSGERWDPRDHPTPGAGRRKSLFTAAAHSEFIGRPSRYWGLKSQAIQTQFQGLNLPSCLLGETREAEGSPRKCCEGLGVLGGGFLSFCCFLTGEERLLPVFASECPAFQLPGIWQASLFLPGELWGASPHGASHKTWAWLGSQTRGPRSGRDTPWRKSAAFRLWTQWDLTLQGSTA